MHMAAMGVCNSVFHTPTTTLECNFGFNLSDSPRENTPTHTVLYGCEYLGILQFHLILIKNHILSGLLCCYKCFISSSGDSHRCNAS